MPLPLQSIDEVKPMQDLRGYSIPYAVKRSERVLFICIWLIMAGYGIYSLLPLFQGGISQAFAARMTTILTLPVALASAAACFAKLHLVPEGIAVTLFGVTLRRINVEDIRLLTPVQYKSKGNITDLIVVSSYTYDALWARVKKKSPKWVQQYGELREGEWVYKYLLRHAGPFSRELNLWKRLLFLDWDFERVKLLRRMYPEAQWMDLTQDRLYDKQMTD